LAASQIYSELRLTGAIVVLSIGLVFQAIAGARNCGAPSGICGHRPTDTDVVYGPLLRPFVDAYFARYANLSLQAIFCGIFPRDQWVRAGGRRSLNTNQDVDLWIRIARQGTMRWYPVFVGENVKEASAAGRADYLSKRYDRRERTIRLLRKEFDPFKTRELARVNLVDLITANMMTSTSGSLWGRGRNSDQGKREWSISLDSHENSGCPCSPTDLSACKRSLERLTSRKSRGPL